jgi:hypothetical protein
MYTILVETHGTMIFNVPIDMRTMDIYESAIKNKPSAFKQYTKDMRAFYKCKDNVTINKRDCWYAPDPLVADCYYEDRVPDEKFDDCYGWECVFMHAFLEWSESYGSTSIANEFKIVAFAIVRTIDNDNFRNIINKICYRYDYLSMSNCNHIYIAWCLFSAENITDNTELKLQVLMAAAKTIALRKTISDGLSFMADQTPENEISLYLETKLQNESNLLIFMKRRLANYQEPLSLIMLRNAINANYLKIAAEHPIVDQLLDDATVKKIEAINIEYAATFEAIIADAPELNENSQHADMIECYKNMAKEEIANIKIAWLRNAIRNEP